MHKSAQSGLLLPARRACKAPGISPVYAQITASLEAMARKPNRRVPDHCPG